MSTLFSLLAVGCFATAVLTFAFNVNKYHPPSWAHWLFILSGLGVLVFMAMSFGAWLQAVLI